MTTQKHRDREWLRRQYHENGLSCTEIANLCNVSRSTVHRNLRKNGIKTRKQGTENFGSEKYHDLEWLREQYHGHNLTYSEIADKCGVSKQTIYNSAKKVGLETENDTRYRDGSWFREKYHSDDWTLKEIAEECDVSLRTIISWRKRHGIPVQYPTGRSHPTSKPPEECVSRKRGENWHQQRQLALERADFECENPSCDADAEHLGQNPDVHHIVPHRFADQYDVNHLSNLVALCRSCHSNVEPLAFEEVADGHESVVDFASTPRAGVGD